MIWIRDLNDYHIKYLRGELYKNLCNCISDNKKFDLNLGWFLRMASSNSKHMKTQHGFIRKAPFIFTFLILCQSCTIYHSRNISFAEAAEKEGKVRVKTTSDRTYAFKKIEQNDDMTYGIAGKNSKAAKELVQEILPESLFKDDVKIRLDELPVQQINPRNKTMSTLVPLMIAAAGILILALTYDLNLSPFGDSGTF